MPPSPSPPVPWWLLLLGTIAGSLVGGALVQWLAGQRQTPVQGELANMFAAFIYMMPIMMMSMMITTMMAATME